MAHSSAEKKGRDLFLSSQIDVGFLLLLFWRLLGLSCFLFFRRETVKFQGFMISGYPDAAGCNLIILDFLSPSRIFLLCSFLSLFRFFFF